MEVHPYVAVFGVAVAFLLGFQRLMGALGWLLSWATLGAYRKWEVRHAEKVLGRRDDTKAQRAVTANAAALLSLAERADTILAILSPNGGSSMADKLDQVVATVGRLEARVDKMATTVDKLDVQQAGFDDRLTLME